MADFVTAKVINLPDFSAQLKAFGFDLQAKIVRSAVSAALQVFKKAVIANVPVHRGRYPNSKYQRVPGTLKRSIFAARSKRSSTPGVEYGIVRPHSGRKAAQTLADAYYWRWVEAGHLIRRRGQALKGGVHRRTLERGRLNKAGAVRTRAFLFMKKSFDDNKDAAIAAFTKRIEDRVAKENRNR